MTLGNPSTAKGFMHWAFLGFCAASLALLVGMVFPSIVPAGATQSKL